MEYHTTFSGPARRIFFLLFSFWALVFLASCGTECSDREVSYSRESTTRNPYNLKSFISVGTGKSDVTWVNETNGSSGEATTYFNVPISGVPTDGPYYNAIVSLEPGKNKIFLYEDNGDCVTTHEYRVTLR